MDRVIVRCSRGALYSTIWVPLMSFKAVRLGPYRLQRCPVHDRVEWAVLVPRDRLTPAEIARAAQVKDIGIP